MKLKVEQSRDIAETEITIRCAVLTPELAALADRIRLMDISLTGKKDGRYYRLPAERLLYADSVDGRTFLYLADDCYESDKRLLELEALLTPMSFVRISKNTLVNLRCLASARPVEMTRMELTLGNGEKLIVSRHYMSEFKSAFGLQ